MNTKGEEKKKRVMGFQVLENECIWMKAGVVNFRLCDNAYDCYNCPFDIGMRKAMDLRSPQEEDRERPGWVQYLQQRYQGSSRPCRHALTGHIDAPKICSMNYECYHCPFDQVLDELDLGKGAVTPNYRIASGYRMAEGYYYHMGHTWACFEHGGRVRVGLDDFLVRVFGVPHTLSLPPLGAHLKQEEAGWTFGRDEEHEAAVLSPVTGTVLAVNRNLEEQPEITHHAPYESGWLCVIEPDLPKRNLKRLYFGEESFRWMEHETEALGRLLGPEYESLAATGGRAVEDLFGNAPHLGWGRLVKTFLHTERT